jgi:hypothetical protein
MKYTQKEILEIQRAIATLNVPFVIDTSDLSKVKLTYTHDKNIFAHFTHVLRYECLTKNPNGQFGSFSNVDFLQFLFLFRSWLSAVKNENPFHASRITQIDNFSPRFYSIFEEAKIINELGFRESSGMIFRKATEILIKDFWLNFLPDYQEVILGETVGGIVFFFYDVSDDKLTSRSSRTYKKRKFDFLKSQDIINEMLPFVEFVNKTFKIGNDFSHYERKLEHFQAGDLEKNIIQIVEYLGERYQIMEAQERVKLLDSKFQNFSIK